MFFEQEQLNKIVEKIDFYEFYKEFLPDMQIRGKRAWACCRSAAPRTARLPPPTRAAFLPLRRQTPRRIARPVQYPTRCCGCRNNRDE